MEERLQLPRPVSLLGLGLALLRLGGFAFGGMGSTLALLRSDLGARRGWITDQDVAEALAITKPSPDQPECRWLRSSVGNSPDGPVR